MLSFPPFLTCNYELTCNVCCILLGGVSLCKALRLCLGCSLCRALHSDHGVCELRHSEDLPADQQSPPEYWPWAAEPPHHCLVPRCSSHAAPALQNGKSIADWWEIYWSHFVPVWLLFLTVWTHVFIVVFTFCINVVGSLCRLFTVTWLWGMSWSTSFPGRWKWPSLVSPETWREWRAVAAVAGETHV